LFVAFSLKPGKYTELNNVSFIIVLVTFYKYVEIIYSKIPGITGAIAGI